MKGTVVVTGGAGYIGSHTIVDLIDQGYDVVSIDNYINSSPGTYDKIKSITHREVTHFDVDIRDRSALHSVFQEVGDVKGIIHFAALKAVGESVEKPLAYYSNNITGLINMLEVCLQYAVRAFIFSSSCTVYGIPESSPVSEATPFQDPASPYGATKQMGERIIKDVLKDKFTKAVLLRYFNPAGAHPSGLLGEDPINPASNLVPAITETAIGKRPELIVFGNDYNTRDGSCVRDYVHIMDLARGHTLALDNVLSGHQADDIEIYNLGIGEGITVLEIIRAFEEVSGQQLNYRIGPRRPGDVPAIYSNYTKIRENLNWNPQYDVKDIMSSAWNWEINRNS